jgi:hypothetical protein
MSSSSYSSGPDLTLATLTVQELSDIVATSNNHAFLHGAFPPDSHSSNLLQYFAYASKNVYDMERELERHRRERQELFEVLKDNRRFRQRIRPIVHFHRRTAANVPRPTRVRVHPYRRPSTPHPASSSSSSSSHVSRRSVVIDPEDALVPRPSSISSASSLISFRTAEEPNPNDQPGSSQNPINVDAMYTCTRCDEGGYLCEECDTRIRTCTRCNQEGHFREDCEARLRTLDTCPLCEWQRRADPLSEQPYAECPHYDIPPGWVRRQQTRLNLLD